jgi:hypothetical protein
MFWEPDQKEKSKFQPPDGDPPSPELDQPSPAKAQNGASPLGSTRFTGLLSA